MFPVFKLARVVDASTAPVDFTISASDCEPLSMNELLELAGEGAEESLRKTSLGYSTPQGLAALREQIAGLYDGIDRDQLLVCIPQEALYLALRTLLAPGDHVVAMYPSYQPHYSIAEGMGCEVSRWHADAESGYRFTADRLQRLLRPTTRLVVMSFPHNPTGFSPPVDDYRKMINAVDQSGAVLISDEIFSGLAIDDTIRVPSAIELSERAIVLNGLSKSYGLGGLRIGWAVTRDREVLQSFMQYRDYTTQFSSSVSEVLALLAIQTRSEILRRNCDRIRDNLGLLEGFVARWSHEISMDQPVVSSLCLIRFHHLSADEFCRRAVSECRVGAASSSLFDYGDRHVRIGLGRNGFGEALERIDQLLSSMTCR